MAMNTKVTASQPKPFKPKYPYLGVYGDPESKKSGLWQIVLFTAPSKGVLVAADDGINSNSSSRRELYFDNCSEILYKPYEGAVTLSND